VRAAGNFGRVEPSIREKVAALARDSSPDVQLQVAIASRKVAGLDALPVLAGVLDHCGGDKLIPSIVWPNLHPLLEESSARFATLATRRKLSPALVLIVPRVIDRILAARKPDAAAVATLIRALAREDVERTRDCLVAVSSRLGELNADSTAELKTHLGPFLDETVAGGANHPLRLSAHWLAARLGLVELDAAAVRRQVVSITAAPTERLQALEVLVAFKDAKVLETLEPCWTTGEVKFLTALLGTLGRLEDPKLADAVLAHYPSLAPEVQPLAIDLLMQREPWARKLLDAVLAKKLPTSVLDANHLRKIIESNDREARWAVEKAFGKVRTGRNPDREKVVADMVAFCHKNPGDPRAGREVFRALCAQCHVIYGEGGTIGPDITTNGRASFDQLVSNILDPSLVIGPAYQVTTVVTKDGRNLTGVISEESDQRLTLKLPGEGVESVPRNNIKYTRISQLSIMPEGLEAILGQSRLADLLAFLSLDKRPGDPDARLIPGAPAPRAGSPNNPPASGAEGQPGK
jgi:putative heme-binding domain-containing protein